MPTDQDDRSYYQQRFADCVEQAAQATTTSARRVHEALARLYADKLKALGADPAPVPAEVRPPEPD